MLWRAGLSFLDLNEPFGKFLSFLQVGQLLQRCRQGHRLEDGAGREGGGEKAVEIDTIIAGIGLQAGGDVPGIEGGGGHQAQDLPRLVVVDGHCALPAVEGPVGGLIQVRIDGEVYLIAPLGPEGAVEQVKAGAMGLKIHEDWGATPAVINHCLNVADEFDVQAAIHTDTLNEGGCVEDTLAAIGGRTIHTYHTEGAGGGHAPDIIRAAAAPNVLPSSTNPTMPYTVNTLDEHLDMLMVCHHLDKHIPEDVAFADSRIRPETIAAEDVLHDMGIFSMMSSDSQAMGRVGEVITRTWQTASKMKDERGALPQDAGHENDNFRVKRYIAKYTINPAITHGISEYVGSVEKGKFADLVLWNPAFFGSKPDMIIKGGMIVASKMGDANASIPTTQPVCYQPMFAAHGKAKQEACLTFVSQAAFDAGIKDAYGLEKTVVPVHGCRSISKKDMVWNDRTPVLTVDPETYKVTVDGEEITSKPAEKLPLTQLYSLF